MADHSNNALQGFSIYQPTLGAALQFFPALGSAELDTMIQAFLPGPGSIKDKRATICMDFYEYAGRTGETVKFYPVFPAVYSPVTTNSPVGSDYASAFSASPVVNDLNMWSFTTPSTPSSVAAATPSSSQAAQSDRKASLVSRSRHDFSNMPGMKILTKDGVDVTNSATRGSKTKEQRDHAHLMRIIKACDACKKRKTRCDPSHKKRSVSQTSQASSPAATKPTKKTKVAAAPPPQISTNTSFMMPEMAMNDFSSFDLGLDAFSGFDGVEALNDFNYNPAWDQQFVNYDQELAVSANYDFLFGLDAESSPSASSGSFYSSTTSSSSSSSQSSPSQQLIPSFEPVPNTLVTGRPAIQSRDVTDGLSGYSTAANGQDTYSQGSRARLRAASSQQDAFASRAVVNTNISTADAPPGQDGQDVAVRLDDSPNSQVSSSRSRLHGTSLSRLTSSASLVNPIASRAQGILVRPQAHIGALDNQQLGPDASVSSPLHSSSSNALARAGPAPVPQSRVPGGPGPLLQVQNTTDRPPKLPAAPAAQANSHNAIASNRSLTGLHHTMVSAIEALLPGSPVAGVETNSVPQSLQAQHCLPGPVPGSEDMRPGSEELRPAVLGTGLGLLVAALVMCATLSFWQHGSFSMQSALFVTPFAAKLWSKKGSEKWQPSTAQKQSTVNRTSVKQTTVEDQRCDGLWQHAARLSLRA